MEIPSKGPLLFTPDQKRSVETPAQPSAQAGRVKPNTIKTDTVSLTEQGQKVQTAVQQARLVPEIREDRVMRLKRQIEEGAYRVKGDQIAANLIDETVENNMVWERIDIDP